MSKARQARTHPFGAAVIGGLVVGILGWIAIAAGLGRARASGNRTPRALAPAPLPEPAAQHSERARA